MNLLLDTHIFLWYITDDPRLPARVAVAIREKSNSVFLSVVSVWEALAKYQIGKLPLPAAPDQYITDRRESHEIGTLSLDEASMSHLLRLPLHHRDPFDRMLMCQALHHDLVIVTVDELFKHYPVKILSAV